MDLKFKKDKINILHLIDTLKRSGAELLLEKISRYLDHKKYKIIIAHLYSANDLRPLFEERNIQVYNLNLKNRCDFLKGLYYIRNILKKEKINLIHTHLYDATILGRLAAKSLGIKNIITTLHYQADSLRGQNPLLNNIKRWIDRKTAHWNTTCIAVSNAVKKEFQQYLNFQNIHVIHNGIDPEDFNILNSLSKEKARKDLNFNNEHFIFLNIGRLHSEKGHIYLLKAFKEVHKKYSHSKLLIIGDGIEFKYLSNIANSMDLLNKSIFFLNKQKNIFPFLKASDTFVLPSLYEGFGMGAIEAMYAKLPVIASHIGGLTDIIEDGKTGFLVPKGDSKSLAESMIKIIERPDLVSLFTSEGYKKVTSHFLIQDSVSKLDQLYQSVQ